MEKVINLHLGSMSVLDLSLKFTKLSMYALSLVSNLRNEMSRFVTSVSKDIAKEFRAFMLHDDIDIYHLMVHAQ